MQTARPRSLLAAILVVSSLGVAACTADGNPPQVDAGADAAARDAGMADAAASDAGPPIADAAIADDARSLDAGVTDLDAGAMSLDAGELPPDAGVPAADAGVPAADAGFVAVDAGRDAGPGAILDAGFDAGTDAGTPCVGLPDGTTCGTDSVDVCAAGVCVASTFTVLRVGDGVAALTTAATAGYLETRRVADGSLVSTVDLPTAASGASQPCTFSGTATSEGGLSRSANGEYVVVAGYAAAPGTPAIATTASAAVNRVVCRASAAGTVDSSTRLDAAFSATNVRSATSSDGSQFWVTGGSGGVQYIVLGATGGTQLTTAPANNHWLAIAGGQLYATSGVDMYTNVYTVGSGLPATGPAVATSLPGMPTSRAAPYGFVLFDRSATVVGLDTLYVADARTFVGGGGVQKWVFDGATWTRAATFDSRGMLGVTGYLAGANVVLIATTVGGATVARFVDTGDTTSTATTLVTAAPNTAYRGVSLPPR